MGKWKRRDVLAFAGSALATAGMSRKAFAQERQFAPRVGDWRGFEITTRVEIDSPKGTSRVWLPVPSIDGEFQQSLQNSWSGNATSSRIVADAHYGAKMLYAEFSEASDRPVVQLTSVVRTRNRAVDWRKSVAPTEEADTLRSWTRPTSLMPTDGIVLATAREAIGGARSDEDKARRLYDWVVNRTYREPMVRGCGVGDIKTMLETANFGGKCGDINGLFVGLCRAAGLPARDLYGIRLAPSAFGYRELGGNPARLQGAQHCRAEVYLKGHGWVAMDPADVGKVMRLESKEWIKTTIDPVVAPVNRALFGGWEGNWLAFNNGHDVVLPGSTVGGPLGFLMYPQAENENGRYDALDPDHFQYTITARELSA
jgi:transglutaminase-like putative cysteine protease